MSAPRRSDGSVERSAPRSRGADGSGSDTAYRVTVSKDYLVFCAGHFITYDDGNRCEALHGHNYRAGVTVWGDLGGDAYVYDFVDLKHTMRGIVDELDHRMLLPRDNPEIEVQRAEGGIRVRYGDRRYLFPERDVVVLPVPNTTAEMLARHLLDRLAEELRLEDIDTVHEVEVEVEESFGQSGWARRSMGSRR